MTLVNARIPSNSTSSTESRYDCHMNITLELPPELRDKLAEEAARLARPVEAVALQAIEASLGTETGTQRSSREEWQQELQAWIASHPPISHGVDDSRDSIYGNDGQ